MVLKTELTEKERDVIDRACFLGAMVSVDCGLGVHTGSCFNEYLSVDTDGIINKEATFLFLERRMQEYCEQHKFTKTEIQYLYDCYLNNEYFMLDRHHCITSNKNLAVHLFTYELNDSFQDILDDFRDYLDFMRV